MQNFVVTTASLFAAQITALEYPCEARTFTRSYQELMEESEGVTQSYIFATLKTILLLYTGIYIAYRFHRFQGDQALFWAWHLYLSFF